MNQFYTYRIKWTVTNMSYYGVRYKRGGTPKDLFVTYFTSSKYVKEYIKLHGLQDIIEVRQIFDTAKDAKNWEERIIEKCQLQKNPNWLNRANRGSFKNIIMDDVMRKKISDAKKKNAKRGGKAYNNGNREIIIYPGDQIPDGFVLGARMTEKRLAHIERLKNLDAETRKIAAMKLSITTKGKPKPEGFGEKISKANKGKKKPHMCGENNNSATPEAKAKISESWKSREPIRWFTNIKTEEIMWVYLKDIESVDRNIWRRGRGRAKLKNDQ